MPTILMRTICGLCTIHRGCAGSPVMLGINPSQDGLLRVRDAFAKCTLHTPIVDKAVVYVSRWDQRGCCQR